MRGDSGKRSASMSGSAVSRARRFLRGLGPGSYPADGFGYQRRPARALRRLLGGENLGGLIRQHTGHRGGREAKVQRRFVYFVAALMAAMTLGPPMSALTAAVA